MSRNGIGVAIPLFSLRTKRSGGVGEIPDLELLVDWTVAIGGKIIRLLPINDTTITMGEGDAYPYSILSVFALHPLYMRLGELAPEMEEEIGKELNPLNGPRLQYAEVMAVKLKLLKKIYRKRGKKDLESKGFQAFLKRKQEHLRPYAAFCFLRDRFGTSDFRKWGEYARFNEVLAYELSEASGAKFYLFVQYHLDRQWQKVHAYAKKMGIQLMGDLPFGVHKKSVEAWRFSEYFNWDKTIGAPPDFYNDEGQNWGFPSYNWDEVKADKYYWLTARMKWMERYFDLVRLDHVLGYFRIWEIPKKEKSALMGIFNPSIPYSTGEIKGADKKQFLIIGKGYHPRVNAKGIDVLRDEYFLKRQDALWKESGKEKLSVIKKSTKMMVCAEDIGVVPKCVEGVLKELRMLNTHVQRMPKSFDIEFERTEDFPKTCFCAPSNHDTSTLREWWEEDAALTKRFYQKILGKKGEPPPKLTEELAEEILQDHIDSPAAFVLFLLQDLFALSDALKAPDPKKERINDPAIVNFKWNWRMHLYLEELFLADSFTKKIAEMIKKGRR